MNKTTSTKTTKNNNKQQISTKNKTQAPGLMGGEDPDGDLKGGVEGQL